MYVYLNIEMQMKLHKCEAYIDILRLSIHKEIEQYVAKKNIYKIHKIISVKLCHITSFQTIWYEKLVLNPINSHIETAEELWWDVFTELCQSSSVKKCTFQVKVVTDLV